MLDLVRSMRFLFYHQTLFIGSNRWYVILVIDCPDIPHCSAVLQIVQPCIAESSGPVWCRAVTLQCGISIFTFCSLSLIVQSCSRQVCTTLRDDCNVGSNKSYTSSLPVQITDPNCNQDCPLSCTILLLEHISNFLHDDDGNYRVCEELLSALKNL